MVVDRFQTPLGYRKITSVLQRMVLVGLTVGVLFLTLVWTVWAQRPTPNQVPADLWVFKSDANPGVRPGGTLTYRIIYENRGLGVATRVVMTDTLPPHTTHLFDGANAAGWTTSINEGVVVWRRDALLPSNSGSFDVVLQVNEDAPAGATLINRVEIATSADEETTSNNTSQTRPTVVRVADVEVLKTGPAFVYSGEEITYTIAYGNKGSEPADQVVITDTLPGGVTFVRASGDLVTGPIVSGQQVVLSVGNLVATGTSRVQLVGAVSPDQPSYSVLTNTVTIGTRTPERNLANNVAIASTQVGAGPPAEIQVRVPVTVPANTVTTFSALVLDRWSHPVEDGTTVFFSGSERVIPNPSAVTVGGVATATLRAGREIGPAVVTATVGSISGSASFEIVPGPVGMIQVTPIPAVQTVGQPVALRTAVFDRHGNPVDAGVTVSFTTQLGQIQTPILQTDTTGVVTATLVATRTGSTIVKAYSAGVQGAAIVMFRPGATEQITVTTDAAAIPVDGATTHVVATLRDRYGNLVDDGVTVRFATSLGTVRPVTGTTIAGHVSSVLTSGSVHGTAAVTVTAGAYSATTQVEFLPADLRIASTHTPGSDILPGTSITYTIHFENIGVATARNVVITDTLPVGLIDTSFETRGVTITQRAGTTYVWEVDSLPPGVQGTIILRGRFDKHYAWPRSQLVANIVTIDSTTADGDPTNNLASSANVILTADVYVQGRVDETGTDPRPGKAIRYAISLGNYGPAVAEGLIVTHTLPAYTRFWQETGLEVGLQRITPDDAGVQIWRYDGIVSGPNFGEFLISLTIDPEAPSGMPLRSRIEVSTQTAESDYLDNIQMIEQRLEGVNLEVMIQGPAVVRPGRMVTYTLRYTNTGTVAAENVVLTSTLPVGVTLLDSSRPAAQVEETEYRWNVGHMDEGQWEQIRLVGRVAPDVRAGQKLRARARITMPAEESYLSDNLSATEAQVIADTPYTLVLEMDTTVLEVGATEPVSIVVLDQFGNPIDNMQVALTTTLGAVSPVTVTVEQGMAEAVFQAPLTPGVGTIGATLDNGLVSSLDVVVEPGPATRLTLEEMAAELPANGRATTILRAYVQDAYGNPVKDGTPVTFDTDRGILYNGTTRHVVGTVDGMAATVLRTGRTAGPATVIARAGAASDQRVIQFLPVVWHYLRLPLIGR